MNIRLSAVMLVVLVVAACTATPRYGESTHASFAGGVIGVVVDENMRVVELEYGSAAEKAGVQVGDILLDLTWIPSDAPAPLPEESDVIYTDTGSMSLSTVESITEGMPLTTVVGGVVVTRGMAVTPIPPPVAEFIEKETVPFTDGDRLRPLVGYMVPLELRLQRGDETLELTVIPAPRVPKPTVANEPIATGTPVMPPYDYF